MCGCSLPWISAFAPARPGHPRQVFSREALLKEAWGYDYLGDSGMVTMAARRLRGKVEDDESNPALIETVRGFGYRLSPPVTARLAGARRR